MLIVTDKYDREAAKNWDKFYKRNSTNFYKDRYVLSLCVAAISTNTSCFSHYLHIVFPDLGVEEQVTRLQVAPLWSPLCQYLLFCARTEAQRP